MNKGNQFSIEFLDYTSESDQSESAVSLPGNNINKLWHAQFQKKNCSLVQQNYAHNRSQAFNGLQGVCKKGNPNEKSKEEMLHLWISKSTINFHRTLFETEHINMERNPLYSHWALQSSPFQRLKEETNPCQTYSFNELPEISTIEMYGYAANVVDFWTDKFISTWSKLLKFQIFGIQHSGYPRLDRGNGIERRELGSCSCQQRNHRNFQLFFD